MGAILYILFLELFNFPENIFFCRRDFDRHLPEKFSSRSWIRRGLISCPPYIQFDEINERVVNSERGELVRGSDPP